MALINTDKKMNDIETNRRDAKELIFNILVNHYSSYLGIRDAKILVATIAEENREQLARTILTKKSFLFRRRIQYGC